MAVEAGVDLIAAGRQVGGEGDLPSFARAEVGVPEAGGEVWAEWRLVVVPEVRTFFVEEVEELGPILMPTAGVGPGETEVEGGAGWGLGGEIGMLEGEALVESGEGRGGGSGVVDGGFDEFGEDDLVGAEEGLVGGGDGVVVEVAVVVSPPEGEGKIESAVGRGVVDVLELLTVAIGTVRDEAGMAAVGPFVNAVEQLAAGLVDEL